MMQSALLPLSKVLGFGVAVVSVYVVVEMTKRVTVKGGICFRVLLWLK